MLKKLILALTVTMVSSAGLAETKWDHLKKDAVQPIVRMTNYYYEEMFETYGEFVTRTEFFPFDAKGQPLKTFVALRFDSFFPVTVKPGDMKYFSRQVPLRHVFSDRLLDLNKVAYFEVHFKIFEKDFFRKQTVAHMVVKLTPQGLVSVGKNTKAVSAKKVAIKSNEGALEMDGEFRLGLSQGNLEKLTTDAAELEKRAVEVLKEIEAAKEGN